MNATTTTAGRARVEGGGLLAEVRAERESLGMEAQAIQDRLAWLTGLEDRLGQWFRERDEQADDVPHSSANNPSTAESETVGEGLTTPSADRWPSLAGLSQADMAAACLRRRSPMTTMEIVDAILASGYEVPGPEEGRRDRLGASLFSLLRRRKKRFARVGPGKWVLIARAGQDGDASPSSPCLDASRRAASNST